ncbi:MAG: hypothetical protein AAF404_19990, partial [Pseudomonadota bacterium]
NYIATEDVLSFTGVAGIVGSWDAVSGTLLLSGSASVADYQTVLRSVAYQNISQQPSELTRVVEFSVNDGAASSAAIGRSVQLTAVNDAPVLTAIESVDLSYQENDGPEIVSSAIMVADVDNTHLNSAIVRFSAGSYKTGEDSLAFVDTGTISSAWDDINGILTLSGTDTVANYQAALRSVTYENLSDNPDPGTLTVEFHVGDAATASNAVTRDLNLTVVNDLPQLQSIEAAIISYVENAAPVALTRSVEITDPDNPSIVSATVQITGNYESAADLLAYTGTGGISGSWDSLSGTLTLSGTATTLEYQQALRVVTYESLADKPQTSTRTVSFTVNDGTADSLAVTRELQIMPVNDAPTLLSVETSSIDFTENSAPAQVSNTIIIADADDTDFEQAVIQISSNYHAGEDLLQFTDTSNISSSWDAVTGTLTLSGTDSVINYQAALRSVFYSNSSESANSSTRTISIAVDDGDASSSVVTRLLEVTPVNDAPVVSGVETAVSTFTENDSAQTISASISITDVDDTMLSYATIAIVQGYKADQDILGFTDTPSISGVWDGTGGVLTLSGIDSVTNYQQALQSVTYLNNSDAPDQGIRKIEFSVSDAHNDSGSGSRSLAIVSVNDAPVVSNTEALVSQYYHG